MQITEIITNDKLRETRMHGSPEFHFEYYLDDIHKYDKHYIEWHWHTELEFLYVKQGTVECLIGSERILLPAGHGMMINSKVIHRFESVSGALMPNILFLPDFIAPKSSAIFTEYVAPIVNSNRAFFLLDPANKAEDEILQKMQQIFELADQSSPNKLDIQIYTAALWSGFAKLALESFVLCTDQKDMLLQARMRLMMQYVFTHYKEKITLTDIASSANISKSEALRCFRLSLQTTPVSYLIEYRLNCARQLLESTDDTITEISVSVGIDNISYFVRIFKEKFNMTPKAFRQAHLLQS